MTFETKLNKRCRIYIFFDKSIIISPIIDTIHPVCIKIFYAEIKQKIDEIIITKRKKYEYKNKELLLCYHLENEYSVTDIRTKKNNVIIFDIENKGDKQEIMIGI